MFLVAFGLDNSPINVILMKIVSKHGYPPPYANESVVLNYLYKSVGICNNIDSSLIGYKNCTKLQVSKSNGRTNFKIKKKIWAQIKLLISICQEEDLRLLNHEHWSQNICQEEDLRLLNHEHWSQKILVLSIPLEQIIELNSC